MVNTLRPRSKWSRDRTPSGGAVSVPLWWRAMASDVQMMGLGKPVEPDVCLPMISEGVSEIYLSFFLGK